MARVTHRRRGVSLIELLVVFAIIGIMMGMLLPALRSARELADDMVCKNNLHQLRLAMHNFGNTHKRLPVPDFWTVELLPFLEEQALADALRGVDPAAVPAAKSRPAVFACINQPDIESTIAGTLICDYMLVLDESGKAGWQITDRQAGLPSGELPPWYAGPVMPRLTFEELVKEGAGPHRGGAFFPE
jgi:prepilin-type N-terminal cleavage/methylation domain-containing protein